MLKVTITMPGQIPPSVNHYKVPIILRGHIAFKETPRAKKFKEDLGWCAVGQSVDPMTDAGRRRVRYTLSLWVFLGHDARGDGDNFFKCVADGLQKAGVIHSDAAIKDWHCYVRRDAVNPRTVIEVEAIYA